jgi:hypothetical protein
MARKVTIGVELAPSTDKLKAAFADVSREIQRQQQLLDRARGGLFPGRPAPGQVNGALPTAAALAPPNIQDPQAGLSSLQRRLELLKEINASLDQQDRTLATIQVASDPAVLRQQVALELQIEEAQKRRARLHAEERERQKPTSALAKIGAGLGINTPQTGQDWGRLLGSLLGSAFGGGGLKGLLFTGLGNLVGGALGQQAGGGGGLGKVLEGVQQLVAGGKQQAAPPVAPAASATPPAPPTVAPAPPPRTTVAPAPPPAQPLIPPPTAAPAAGEAAAAAGGEAAAAGGAEAAATGAAALAPAAGALLAVAAPVAAAVVAVAAADRALDVLGKTATKLVAGGLNAVTTGLQALQSELGPIALGLEAAQGAGAALADLGKGTGIPVLSTAIAGLGTFLGSTAAAVQGFLGTMTQLAGTFNPASVRLFQIAVQDVQGVIGSRFVPVLQLMTDAVRFFGDALQTVLPSQQAITAALAPLRTAWEQVRAALIPVVEQVAPLFQGVLLAALQGFGGIVGAVATQVLAAFESLGGVGGILGTLQSAWTSLMTFFQPVIDGVLAIGSSLGGLTSLLGPLENLWEALKVTFGGLAQTVMELFGELGMLTGQLVSTGTDGVAVFLDVLSEVAPYILGPVVSALTLFVNVLRNVVETVTWGLSKLGILFKAVRHELEKATPRIHVPQIKLPSFKFEEGGSFGKSAQPVQQMSLESFADSLIKAGLQSGAAAGPQEKTAKHTETIAAEAIKQTSLAEAIKAAVAGIAAAMGGGTSGEGVEKGMAGF